jgi:SPP1 family predicted phage head-tail adaptor
MLCSQDLNRRITIERPVETDNGAGGVTVSWVKVTEAWAKMRPGRGGERQMNGQLTATTMETITIRYIRGVSEKWRIRFEDRFFNIRDIADLEERHIYLEMACEEGVAQ